MGAYVTYYTPYSSSGGGMMMWGLMFLLVPLVVSLACLAGIVVLWVFAWKGRGGGGDSELSTCGRCGYAVRGIESLHCPECGTDLREAGIVTPRQRGRVHPVVFVLLWSILLPIPSCSLSGIATMVGPQVKQITENVTLTPPSGHLQSIDLYGQGSGGSQLQTATLNIQGTSGTGFAYTEVDLVTMQHSNSPNYNFGFGSMFVGAAQPTINGPVLDKQELLNLMQQAGAPQNDPQVDAEADELLQVLQSAHANGLSNATVTHFTASNQSSFNFDYPWFGTFWIAMGVFGLIWLAGLFLYFHHRARQQQPLGAPQ